MQSEPETFLFHSFLWSGSRITKFFTHSFLMGKTCFRDDRAPLLKKNLAETELFAGSRTKILKLFASAKVVLGQVSGIQILKKISNSNYNLGN